MSAVSFGPGAFRLPRPAGSDAAQLSAALLAEPGVDDLVITEDHVLVVGDALPAAIAARLATASSAPPAPPGQTHVIRVRYDGPDLGELGLPAAEIIRRHVAAPVSVRLLGFLPGFAYLGPIDPALVRPRRDSPRPRVPAGAVGLAGPYTGVYPSVSPGGWHLVGSAVGWRALGSDGTPTLALGDAVRFEATDEPPAPAAAPPRPAPASTGLAIRAAAALVSVQGLGRPGRLHLGLPPGGTVAPRRLIAANLAVGNPVGAPALELFHGARLAAAGRRLRVSIDGAPAVELAPDAELAVPGEATRVSIVAVAGGLDAPGTHRGVPLRAGDVIAVGAESGRAGAGGVAVGPATRALRLHPGPDAERFAPGAFAAFVAATHVVSPLGDRVGARLAAPAGDAAAPWLALADPQAASAPMRRGAVQLTPGGEAIVLGAEHPVTGGYPVIGVVDAVDVEEIFAAPAGTALRFAPA